MSLIASTSSPACTRRKTNIPRRRAFDQRALAIHEKALGPNDPDVAQSFDTSPSRVEVKANTPKRRTSSAARLP